MYRPRQIYVTPSGPTHIPIGQGQEPLSSKIFSPTTLLEQRQPLYMDDLYDLMSVDRVCSTSADCQRLLREYVGHHVMRFVEADCVNRVCNYSYYPAGGAQHSYKHPLYSTQKKKE